MQSRFAPRPAAGPGQSTTRWATPVTPVTPPTTHHSLRVIATQVGTIRPATAALGSRPVSAAVSAGGRDCCFLATTAADGKVGCAHLCYWVHLRFWVIGCVTGCTCVTGSLLVCERGGCLAPRTAARAAASLPPLHATLYLQRCCLPSAPPHPTHTPATAAQTCTI